MLPVERPKELVRFEWSGAFSGSMSSFGGDGENYFSYPMYKDLRDQNQVFTGVLAADRAQVGLSWHNQAESQDAEVVSGNYFQLLGLKPAAGRLITPQDDTTKNANPVAVLSYTYWKTRFGGSPRCDRPDPSWSTVIRSRFSASRRKTSSPQSAATGPACSFPSAWLKRHPMESAPQRSDQPPVSLAHTRGAAQARNHARNRLRQA